MIVGRLTFLALGVSALASAVSGCETDAVGIGECRDIEYARCEAALHCGLGVDSEEAVTECKRFARDNCLHGLETSDRPGSTETRRCVAAILKAGACARDNDDAAFRFEACEGMPRATTSSSVTACEVVQSPEEARDCAFLIDEPEEEPEPEPEPEPDAGNDSAS
jgi:hypothetical protein